MRHSGLEFVAGKQQPVPQDLKTEVGAGEGGGSRG